MTTDQTNEPRLSDEQEPRDLMLISVLEKADRIAPHMLIAVATESAERLDHLRTSLAAEKKRADEAVEMLSAVTGAAQLELKALQDELHNEDGICHRWTHQQRFGKLNVPVQQALTTLNTQGTADAGKGKTDDN